jgi:cell wall-associated NlpC family hydrolase
VLHARRRLASALVSTALVAALVGTTSAHATEVTTDPVPTATDSATVTTDPVSPVSTVTTDPTTTATVEPVSTTTLALAATATTVATSATTTVKPALTLAQKRAILTKKKRAKAVRIAKAQVGDNYVAGRSGPSAFDCSGLALYVTKKATGRSLPHYSKAQFRATKRVSKHNLKPGDLVFFFKRGAHHVGVYIGHGKMVHAANPRADVRIDYVFRGWYGQHYSGAGRTI